MWNTMSQWRSEFTVRDFSATFASPDPGKVLHDMCRKGLLEKTGWGRYRVTPQDQYVRKKADISAAYDRIRSAGVVYAFTGPDAVFFWTKGGYNADRFFGFYPIIFKVRREDLRKWKVFFHAGGHKFIIEGSPIQETLFGVFYSMRPVDEFRQTKVGGYSVEPLKDVVKFCQDNIYTYEPALQMLDEMYMLGLGVKYSESSLQTDKG
ncbi:hypothetical protein AUG19_03365 [archaeon 13_1_20CM_2_54_9]|nr:MAG: hypothetical protein AUG19_03365 [archaeon 13_1_20CM_2_54_9]